jgi:hypothetical protein
VNTQRVTELSRLERSLRSSVRAGTPPTEFDPAVLDGSTCTVDLGASEASYDRGSLSDIATLCMCMCMFVPDTRGQLP